MQTLQEVTLQQNIRVTYRFVHRTLARRCSLSGWGWRWPGFQIQGVLKCICSQTYISHLEQIIFQQMRLQKRRLLLQFLFCRLCCKGHGHLRIKVALCQVKSRCIFSCQLTSFVILGLGLFLAFRTIKSERKYFRFDESASNMWTFFEIN